MKSVWMHHYVSFIVHTFMAQDALNVDIFSSSDEAFAADALFSAYRSGNEESVRGGHWSRMMGPQ